MKLPRLNLPAYSFRVEEMGQKARIFDPIRKKYVALTPEEWVRQHFLQFLIQDRDYPAGLTAVETTLKIYEQSRRCDIAIYDRQTNPVAIVECKAPDVAITVETFEQIALYNSALRVNYLMVTNGLQHYCCRIDYDGQQYKFLPDIPVYSILNTK